MMAALSTHAPCVTHTHLCAVAFPASAAGATSLPLCLRCMQLATKLFRHGDQQASIMQEYRGESILQECRGGKALGSRIFAYCLGLQPQSWTLLLCMHAGSVWRIEGGRAPVHLLSAVLEPAFCGCAGTTPASLPARPWRHKRVPGWPHRPGQAHTQC